MTTPIPLSVARVVDLASPVVDTASLRAAIAGWSAPPWRVAVVGRTAVGKSTLVNALVGRRATRTGLGGVTTGLVEIAHDGVSWVDTPGLDGPGRDDVLALVAAVDAAVWVTDGLQPMTAGERHALHDLPEGTLVHVVVSRADRVDPAEAPAVVERVRSLAARWSPATLRLADLRAAERTGADTLADLAEPAPWRSRRRKEALRTALRDVARAVAALPPPPDREAIAAALVARWRAVVREVTSPVEEAVRTGHVEHRAVALRWLGAAAIPAREAFVAEAPSVIDPLVATEGPELGLPEADDHGPLDVAGGLGGAHAALRAIRSAAARWMLDGEVGLREWLATRVLDRGPVGVREVVDQAVEEALWAVDPGARAHEAPC